VKLKIISIYVLVTLATSATSAFADQQEINACFNIAQIAGTASIQSQSMSIPVSSTPKYKEFTSQFGEDLGRVISINSTNVLKVAPAKMVAPLLMLNCVDYPFDVIQAIAPHVSKNNSCAIYAGESYDHSIKTFQCIRDRMREIGKNM